MALCKILTSFKQFVLNYTKKDEKFMKKILLKYFLAK